MYHYTKKEIEEVKMLVDAGIALTTKQTAIFLNCSPRTLEAYRVKGNSPRFEKHGRMVRYPIESLKEYKNARIKYSTSELSCQKNSL